MAGIWLWQKRSKKVLEQGKIEVKILPGVIHTIQPFRNRCKGRWENGWLSMTKESKNVHWFEWFWDKADRCQSRFQIRARWSIFTQDSEWLLKQHNMPLHLTIIITQFEDYKESYRGGANPCEVWSYTRIQEKRSYTIELPPYAAFKWCRKGSGWDFMSYLTQKCTQVWSMYATYWSVQQKWYHHHVQLEKLQNLKDPKNVKDHTELCLWILLLKMRCIILNSWVRIFVADVDPTEEYCLWKTLDTHASVYSFSKIQVLIKKYIYAEQILSGIPTVLDMKSIHIQLEIGLGPCIINIQMFTERFILIVCW